MRFRGSNSREAYSESMGELSAHGEKPERLPRLEPCAEELVEGFPGVREVHNRLRISR